MPGTRSDRPIPSPGRSGESLQGCDEPGSAERRGARGGVILSDALCGSRRSHLRVAHSEGSASTAEETMACDGACGSLGAILQSPSGLGAAAGSAKRLFPNEGSIAPLQGILRLRGSSLECREQLGTAAVHGPNCTPNSWPLMRDHPVQRHFDALAHRYDRSAQWRTDGRILNWFFEVLHVDGTILDLGTGTGLVGERLAQRGSRIVGVDRSPGMLSHAAKRSIRPLLADVHTLPFRDGAFSAVATRQLLHYTDDAAVLREVKRVLRHCGRFASAHVVATGRASAAWWAALKQIVQPLRVRFYAGEDLAARVTQAGLRIVASEMVEVRRADSWQRFFINTPAGRIPEALDMLRRVPASIVDEIDLVLSSERVEYRQQWQLLLADRHLTAEPPPSTPALPCL